MLGNTLNVVDGGGDGDVTLVGTDGSMKTGSEFKFASADDSNVEVKLDEESNRIVIGVYYV